MDSVMTTRVIAGVVFLVLLGILIMRRRSRAK
jgi:hypothetical protein